MKLQILQENLSKAVTLASRFTSSKAQLPILGNILLTADKTKLFISSTNLEISVSTAVGAKVEEEGTISIPSKVIAELVTNLPKETITLEVDKEQMKVSTTDFSSNVLGMNSSDFPKIPNSINKDKSIRLPEKEFSESLSQVSFASSVDETRPVLTGVLFLFSEGSLSLVATDGFRLSQKKIKVEGLKDVSKIVLPKLILSEVGRSGENGEGQILLDLQENDKQVVFGLGDTILTSRLLEGDYPDFEKIIPKSSSTTIFVDKEELLRAVKLASIFARDAGNIVKLKVLKDSVKVSAESGQSGSQETKVDAVISGDPGLGSGSNKEGEISFNFKFLEDFLHSVKGEEVKIELNSVNSAGVFTDSSDSSYLHLIMPVKT